MVELEAPEKCFIAEEGIVYMGATKKKVKAAIKCIFPYIFVELLMK